MQNLVEIGPLVLEKKIFKMLFMYFHCFVLIYPWKTAKRRGPLFEQTFTQGCFEPSLVEISPAVLEKMQM